MSDQSERKKKGGNWWQRVLEVAQEAYLRWQHAGPLEKAMVVCEFPVDSLGDYLSRLEPGRQRSDQLRRWHRLLGRTQDLGTSPPDPAILLSGLDKLCQGVIAAHPH